MTTDRSDPEVLSFQAMLAARNLLPYPLLCSAPVMSRYSTTIELHDVADGLIPGGFAAYRVTSHDSTYCVSGVSPHKL